MNAGKILRLSCACDYYDDCKSSRQVCFSHYDLCTYGQTRNEEHNSEDGDHGEGVVGFDIALKDVIYINRLKIFSLQVFSTI